MEVMRRTIVVVALEFGTTYSGLAFSMIHQFETDPLKIRLCYHSNSQCDRSSKTPTCILLDKEKQFVAFGYDAEYRYAELVDDNEEDDYYFFDRFTMNLHNNENVTRDMVLKDKTGKQCSAVEAGLHAENVLLITEPEAAFTYCYYITTARLQESKHGIMIEDPGTKSMIVELGGVTADITVLQTTYNGQHKVLCRPTGDDCGGASVDDRFCNMLKEIFGGNAIAEFKRQYHADWIHLIREVRRKKEAFTTSNTHTTSLRIPATLMNINDLESAIHSSWYVNEITTLGDKLRFKADFMIKLFTPTIDSIITLMKNTVSNKSTNGLSNILMVGGFSKCPMIQKAVYKAFPDDQIIIPYYPGLSGLKGAVLFGHRPDYNRSELCDEENIGK